MSGPAQPRGPARPRLRIPADRTSSESSRARPRTRWRPRPRQCMCATADAAPKLAAQTRFLFRHKSQMELVELSGRTTGRLGYTWPTTGYAIGGTATLALRYSIISASTAARTRPSEGLRAGRSSGRTKPEFPAASGRHDHTTTVSVRRPGLGARLLATSDEAQAGYDLKFRARAHPRPRPPKPPPALAPHAARRCATRRWPLHRLNYGPHRGPRPRPRPCTSGPR